VPGGYRSVQQFCADFQIPVKTFYKWREQGYGPRAIRVGRWLRIPEDEIARFVAELTNSEEQRRAGRN
jgi:predicted site-specific integrase-resolvase